MGRDAALLELFKLKGNSYSVSVVAALTTALELAKKGQFCVCAEELLAKPSLLQILYSTHKHFCARQ